MKVKYTHLVLELKGRVYWQDFVKSDDDLLTFVEKLEKRTSLKFIAKKEGDTLNGFVTQIPNLNGFIVSIYGINKKPDEESNHTFEAIKVTKELEDKIYGSV